MLSEHLSGLYPVKMYKLKPLQFDFQNIKSVLQS
jgi:hypothetical protein